jgi:LPXTG-site transpeptidase (sortase) family protein
MAWVYAVSLYILTMLGFVPYYVDGSVPTVSRIDTEEIEVPISTSTGQNSDTNSGINSGETPAVVPVVKNPIVPERISIPSLDKELPISNPKSKDVAVLDQALLTSVVRYPDSGLLNVDGNIFIFGHSTGHRTVNNQLFKAFNGIQNLEMGATILVYGGGRVFVYQVRTVTAVNADVALVNISVRPGEKKLTLSTCDSFGSKSDRFVVVAEYLTDYAETQTTPQTQQI